MDSKEEFDNRIQLVSKEELDNRIQLDSKEEFDNRIQLVQKRRNFQLDPFRSYSNTFSIHNGTISTFVKEKVWKKTYFEIKKISVTAFYLYLENSSSRDKTIVYKIISFKGTVSEILYFVTFI